MKRVPNPYQVVYEDGSAWRTIHVDHSKLAKLTAPDLPLPTPAPEPPRPTLGYLPRSLQRPCPRQPPPPTQAAAPAEGRSLSPTASVPAPRSSAPTTSEMRPLATAPADPNPEPASRPRRTPRLNPELARVCALQNPSRDLVPQSKNSLGVARTHPLVLSYNQCLGAKEDPLAFHKSVP